MNPPIFWIPPTDDPAQISVGRVKPDLLWDFARPSFEAGLVYSENTRGNIPTASYKI